MGRTLGRIASVAALSLLAAACSTPGISYLARVPAGAPEAAAYRTVSVGYFAGPQGDWYAGALEGMLLNADFDGGPWFIVHDPAAPEGTYGGRYSGTVDILAVDVDEYTRTKKKCVEWDGLFDCEHRAEVLQACIDVDVDAAVRIRLTDVRDGAVVFYETYQGHAGEHDCDDVKIITGKYAGKRKRGYGPYRDYYDRFGGSSGYLTHDLVQQALRDTLSDIRLDIAPYNNRAKAPLVAEAIDPEARADPRFAQAVEAAGDGNQDMSCRIWTDLVVAYPQAPGVRHNAGACAEASGNLEAAQLLYAEAVDAMAFHRRDGDTFDRLVKALNRISSIRTGEAALSELVSGGSDGTDGRPVCPDCITSGSESVRVVPDGFIGDDEPL
ncbi:MAG: hypothetical protein AAGJ32_05295 [Pseudomonadota bacterium]